MPRSDRPIDNYPRLRDAGAFVYKSGLIPAACGVCFVLWAAAGNAPALSATFAFINGVLFGLVFADYTRDD
jgi:hypothetical protein